MTTGHGFRLSRSELIACGIIFLLAVPAVEGLLFVSRRLAPVPPLVAVGAFAAALWVVVGRAAATAHRRRPGVPRPARAQTVEPALAVERLERRLAAVPESQLTYELDVRPRLAQLAVSRLADRYGVVATDQPDRARQLLGEPLWALLREPKLTPAPGGRGKQPRGPELAVIAELVDAVERL